MSWMKMLADTYDAYEYKSGAQSDSKFVLLPISHSTVQAQIEVTIETDGTFLSSKKIEKDDPERVTIIPVTVDSATRANLIAPHPLSDKLCYIAGDYSTYTKKDNAEYYSKYIEGLKAWVDSPYTHSMIEAVYAYLSKGTLIRDLLSDGTLQLDENEVLSDKVNKIQGFGQTGAVVRFRVGTMIGEETATWKMQELYQLYIQYYESTKKSLDLCYVTGTMVYCSEKHQSKLRNAGDKAKLISGNDTSGFTFRGRFLEKDQVATIGYMTTEKAHNALRWLLQKQGYVRDGAAIVVWEVHGKGLPDIFSDSIHAYPEIMNETSLQKSEDSLATQKITKEDTVDEEVFDFDIEEDDEVDDSTGEYYANKVKKAIAGYANKFEPKDQVVLISLDAATQGRMSITYYQEFLANQFITQVANWHEKCTWERYIKVEENKKVWADCAPAPREIALAAFGVQKGKGYLEADDKLIRSTVQRILPCIVNSNNKIPGDIVRATVNRASIPEAYDGFVWENQVMRIACALIKYNSYGGEKENMRLEDEKNKSNRSFLFGRLLAVLDEMERRALYEKGEDGKVKEARMTNAKRLWNAYTRQPAKMYAIIRGKLTPYLKKLNNGSIEYFDKITEDILDALTVEQYQCNKPLDENYLPGYYMQREEIRRCKKIDQDENKEEEITGGTN